MMTSLRGALRSCGSDHRGTLPRRQLGAIGRWLDALDAPRTAVRLDVGADLGGVPDDIASNVYRIAQECLTNAIRHGAPSEVRVSSDGSRSGRKQSR